MNEPSRDKLRKACPAAFDNFLMTKYERLARLTQTRSYPYVIMIDPSSICQLRCPACFTGMANERRRKYRSREFGRPIARLAYGILDALFEECGHLLFYCHFYNWGEPLLNEDLPNFIAAANVRNIYTKVDTNLSLRLTDDKLKDLLMSGLSEIAVSIDGFSQQTYERYRRGGRFELVLENLTRLAAMRDRLRLGTKIIWSFLVFEFNEHEVPETAAFCRQHNIHFNPRDAVVFGPYTEWLPAYRREGKPNPYRTHRPAALQSPQWTTPAGLLPLYTGRPAGRSCAWHYAYTTINADGGVLPCCGLYQKRADFGVVSDTPGSFGQVWNNANFKTVRRTFPDATASAGGYPAAECSQCTRTASFRDHYAVLDREIIRTYWSFPEGSEVRQFDEFYTLLQRSPAAFAAAYAARYDATAASEVLA